VSLISSESMVVLCPFFLSEETLILSVVYIIGKFFGLLLDIYLNWFPETVSKLVVLDAPSAINRGLSD
jgi:hypothetical protein